MKEPYDYIKECKALQQYYEANKEASKIFEMQKNDIKEISKKKGYKHIKEFFLRQYNNGLSALETADVNNLGGVAFIQGQTAIAKKFLTYLELREK